MADVLGVTGSVVGIVSLGLEVCQGIIKYYVSVRDRRANIERLLTSTEMLVSTLEQVKVSISTGVFSSSQVDNVQKNIQACEAGILDLKEELTRIKDVAPTPKTAISLKDKLHAKSRLLLYPFKEGTLGNLQEAVDDVHSNLGLALQALHLSAVPIHIEKLQHLSEQVSAMTSQMNTLTLRSQGQEAEDILHWISNIQARLPHKRNLRKYQPNTCSYVFESPTFLDWLGGQNRILWCYGSPGAGKSVATAAIIDTLDTTLTSPVFGVAAVYCTYANRSEETLEQLLGCLVSQLIRRKDGIPEIARQAYNNRHVDGQPDTSLLLRILGGLIAGFHRTYIVVDALDECSQDGKVARNLVRILAALGGEVQLLFASRFVTEFDFLVGRASRLEIAARNNDVRLFLNAAIDKDDGLLKLCNQTDSLREDIVNKITENSGGMFLLADLHIRAVATKLSPKKLRKALDTLPDGLNSTYDDTMNRILEGQVADRTKIAMIVMEWVVSSKSRLYLWEIQHILAIHDIDDDGEDLDVENLYSPDVILDTCAGLVVLDQPLVPSTNDFPTSQPSGRPTGKIDVDSKFALFRLAHHSVEEYFEGKRSSLFDQADIRIARQCFRYLRHTVRQIESWEASRPEDGGTTAFEAHKVHIKFGLLPYAVSHWYLHAAQNETDLVPDIVAFLSNPALLAKISRIWWSFKLSKDLFGPLYLPERININRPPLLFASAYGLIHTVDSLLISGADIGLSNETGVTALHNAATYGYASLVDRLVHGNAAVDSRTKFGETPLFLATKHGHSSVIERLLNAGAHIDAYTDRLETPLFIATKCGRLDLVNQLIKAGANANIIDDRGTNPLNYAIIRSWNHRFQNQPQIAEKLIDAGAKFLLDGPLTDSPLVNEAIHLGSESGLKLLIRGGLDGSLLDRNGKTLLHRAVSETPREGVLDREKVRARFIRCLLVCGIDVNVEDANGRSAFDDVVATYVAFVTKHYPEGYHGNSLVAKHVTEGYPGVFVIDTLLLLLSLGADINRAAANGGRTAFGSLVECYKEVVSGVDSIDGVDKSKLDDLARTMKVLMQHGADVSFRTSEGQTILHLVVRYADWDSFICIIGDSGEILNEVDSQGQTALHIAAARVDARFMARMYCKLVEAGASTCIRNKQQETGPEVARRGCPHREEYTTKCELDKTLLEREPDIIGLEKKLLEMRQNRKRIIARKINLFRRRRSVLPELGHVAMVRRTDAERQELDDQIQDLDDQIQALDARIQTLDAQIQDYDHAHLYYTLRGQCTWKSVYTIEQ